MFKWRKAAPTALFLLLGIGLLWNILEFLPARNEEGLHFDAHFLEVPQIIWGLNNQKIAIARAALTARYLNRTLLMPNLSPTIFHNESDAIPFDEVFSVTEFNSRCKNFARISPRSALLPGSSAIKITKGSGRRWNESRDLQHLQQAAALKSYNLLTIVGKNPFLWPDHWDVRDYVKIFGCLVLKDEILDDVRIVASRLQASQKQVLPSSSPGQRRGQPSYIRSDVASQRHGQPVYVAVHMRIEEDWMIHCKNTEKRAMEKEGKRLSICSNKTEIISRVGMIPGLRKPSVVYLAVADVLLRDSSLLQGWGPDLVPFEKKRLRVEDVYAKHSYLVQAAIDFEICKRAHVFVGNSFSTFSSLVVLERTLETPGDCGRSFAYNLVDDHGNVGCPRPWLGNLSKSKLSEISYESNDVSCVS